MERLFEDGPLAVAPPDRPKAPGARPEDELDWAFLRQAFVPEPLPDPDPLPVVDLFSGCGGLTVGALEGARRAGRGAALTLAVDQEPAPLEVLAATLRGERARYQRADLAEVLAPLDEPITTAERRLLGATGERPIVVAGPPCQGHSALNNHTRHDDPRNDLYLAVARVAKLLRPRAVIVENVRGVGNDRRYAMSRCMATLRTLGYAVDARRIDLHTIGVPQRRVRHVVVATRSEPFEWNLPAAPGRTVAWAIGDLLDAEGTTPFDIPSKITPDNEKRIEWLFDNDAFDLPNERRPRCHRSDHSYVSMYGRLRWDAPAQTITSGFGSMGQGRYVHPLRRRTLTPHEAARLQFLPDFMAFGRTEMNRTAIATTIGNVAPPLLAATLVEALNAQGLL
jgi:DNA (cytosine-5)-methyltransferase 1